MKKNKKTFAQRAAEIEKKYSRAEWDSIEKQDFEREMMALMQEQEAIRESMDMTNEQEFAYGGRTKYQTGGSEKLVPNNPEIPWGEQSFWQKLGTINRAGMAPQNLIMGDAPVAGTAVVNPGAWKYGKQVANIAKAREAKKVKQLGKVMDDLVDAPGSLAKQYPTGVRNLGELGKRRIDMSNIPLRDIGAVTGVGALGAGVYGLANSDMSGTQDATGSNLDLRGWSPQGIGDLYNIPSKAARRPGEPIGPNPYVEQPYDPYQVPEFGATGVNNTPSNQYDLGDIEGAARAGERGAEEGPPLSLMQSRGLGKPSLEIPELEAEKLGNGQLRGYQYNPRESWWDRNKEYAPYALSGLSNIFGNLLLSRMAKKNKPQMNAAMAQADLVDFEPQAEQMRRDATTSKNVALRNARNLGANAGATIANINAATAGIDRTLGNRLTQLYGQEGQINTRAKNMANLSNQRSRNMAEQFNKTMDYRTLQDRLGYTGSALSTPANVIKDLRLQNMDDRTLAMYNNMIPFIGRNYELMGSLMNGVQRKVRGFNG